MRDFNKKEDDFSSLEEYNDYLEEVEDIIYNLVNGIDTVETNRRIDQYKKENKDIIIKNKMRIGRSELELDELLEEEKANERIRRLGVLREETEVKKRKIRAKEALIDELMFSQENAKDIVKTFQVMEEEEEQKIVEKVLIFSNSFTAIISFNTVCGVNVITARKYSFRQHTSLLVSNLGSQGSIHFYLLKRKAHCTSTHRL